MAGIRVVQYCNQFSLGGTEKTMEIFCRILHSQGYDVFALGKKPTESWLTRLKVELGAVFGHKSALGKKKLWASMNARKPNLEAILGPSKVLQAKNDADLARILIELKPDVLHVHYSGRPEAPLIFDDVMKQIPVIVTTNQFELENTAPSHRYVKKMYFVSRWLLNNKALWAAKDPRADIMYNPVEMPLVQTPNDNLRAELGIPADAFVVGRVGRADNGIHDPISLRAFSRMMDERSYFVALAPPLNMIQEARALGIKNFIALAPTVDPLRLSRFYNTIDVLAHARRDGETFGCNIAEAMIHGKPVVSHLTPYMNAQTETVDSGGVVTEQDDDKTYEAVMRRLRDDHNYRHQLGVAARERALTAYEASKLGQKLMRDYESLLASNAR